MSSKPIGGLVAGTPYASDKFATIEKTRLNALVFARNEFIENGILKIIDDHATQFKSDLERDAPFDVVGYDDYHMNDHMTKETMSLTKKGTKVESEAGYSGLLEYGLASHGVQHIFFRPNMEKNWKAYKEEVIKIMRGIYRI